MTVKRAAGAKSESASAEPVKKTAAKKASAKKSTTRKTTAAKSAAADKKTVKKTAARKAPAKKAAASKPAKPAVMTPEMAEKEAAAASRKELALKSAEENNVQKNLSARSAVAAKAAAKGFKKPARKKAATRKGTAAKAIDAQPVQFRGLPEVPGKPYAQVLKEKEEAGAMASRKELAKKSVDENNVQKNLSARSIAAAKALTLEESDQSAPVREQRIDAIAAEAKDGEKIIEAIDKVDDAPYQEKPAPKARASKALKKAEQAEILAGADQSVSQIDARMDVIAAEVKDGVKIIEAIDKIDDAPYQNAPAKKKAVKTDPAAEKAQMIAGSHQSAAVREERIADIAQSVKDGQKIAQAIDKVGEEEKILEGSDQSAPVRTQRIDEIAAEAKDGEKIIEAIDKVDDAPYQLEEIGEKKEKSAASASRAELAQKSVDENNVQKNLSARSETAAKAAAKGFKKPARKRKAKAAKAASAPEASKAAKERLLVLIPETEGTPYEETVAQIEKKAAMASRKELAARTKNVITSSNPKVLSDEQKKFYGSLDNNTLVEMANAAGLHLNLDQLKEELTKAPDVDDQIDKYLAKVAKAAKPLVYSVDGFDASVIPFLCKKIAATLPNKAQDNVDLAKKIAKDTDRMLINEGMNDSAIYKDLLDDVRRILVIAQHNNLYTLDEVEKIIPADLHKLVDRFMEVAYTILPGWQYNDVKYYEGFIYGVMAQFDDLANLQNKALMDIADLYIKHGDYQKGNDGYGYVLRENQLKDQIYFRFANVYVPIDLQRAKSIAQDALRIIDGRYDYYPKIIEILQK